MRFPLLSMAALLRAGLTVCLAQNAPEFTPPGQNIARVQAASARTAATSDQMFESDIAALSAWGPAPLCPGRCMCGTPVERGQCAAPRTRQPSIGRLVSRPMHRPRAPVAQ